MPGQSMIDQGRLLDVLGIEVAAVAEETHDIDPAAPVPTCPGWTVGELLRHLGSVYRAALAWLVGGSRPREWQRAPGPAESVHDYLRGGYEALHDELARHAPDEGAPTWWPADTTYGFWRRRMAHETTIHRVDIQTAAGVDPSEVAEDVAVDGIDEVLTLWFGQRLATIGLTGTRDCSVAVCSGGHSWLARAGPKETVGWRCGDAEADRADVTVRGEPMQTYLWLWGRAAPGTVTVEGTDEDAAGQLWALLRLATR